MRWMYHAITESIRRQTVRLFRPMFISGVVDAVRAGEQASTAKASLAARRAFVLLPSERLSIWEDDLIALVTC